MMGWPPDREKRPIDRGPAGREDRGPREFAAVAVAVEVPGHRNAFGVVLAESGVWSVDTTETVDEGLASQPGLRADPFVGVRDRAEIDGKKAPTAPNPSSRERRSKSTPMKDTSTRTFSSPVACEVAVNLHAASVARSRIAAA